MAAQIADLGALTKRLELMESWISCPRLGQQTELGDGKLAYASEKRILCTLVGSSAFLFEMWMKVDESPCHSLWRLRCGSQIDEQTQLGRRYPALENPQISTPWTPEDEEWFDISLDIEI